MPNVKVIATDNWLGAEGFVKRGDEITVPDHRAEELIRESRAKSVSGVEPSEKKVVVPSASKIAKAPKKSSASKNNSSSTGKTVKQVSLMDPNGLK